MDDVENQQEISNFSFEGGSFISNDECIDLLAPS
jgi:hypothetical protein